MSELDSRTIERLAQLICDQGGAYERRIPDLLRLFDGAGWEVEYTAGPRIPWLVDMIQTRNDDREAIDALLRRIVDPREYDGGLADARAFLGPLNALLAADGIELRHQGSRSVLQRFDPGAPDLDRIATALADPGLRQLVRSLVSSSEMADILVARLDEVARCRQAGSFLLAVIGTGSFIEGLLYDVLRLRDPATRQDKDPKLAVLLQRAHARGWIQHDAFSFGDLVREYRNLVHPREQLELGFTPDNDTVLMCWQPVLAVLNDLQERLPGPRR